MVNRVPDAPKGNETLQEIRQGMGLTGIMRLHYHLEKF
jgi:hypothetical protein